jgi:hypothetical protein
MIGLLYLFLQFIFQSFYYSSSNNNNNNNYITKNIIAILFFIKVILYFNKCVCIYT